MEPDQTKEKVKQHQKPCKECPWRRIAPPGWLGDIPLETFLEHAHSESVIDCHLLGPRQCVGAAIFRANVCKVTRFPDLIISKPRDPVRIFASDAEFREHHTLKKKI